jgi:hypothetical protein
VRRRLGEGLVRDGLVYGVGLALQRGLAFLVLPAATRILDPHDFGGVAAVERGLVDMDAHVGRLRGAVLHQRQERTGLERPARTPSSYARLTRTFGEVTPP